MPGAVIQIVNLCILRKVKATSLHTGDPSLLSGFRADCFRANEMLLE